MIHSIQQVSGRTLRDNKRKYITRSVIFIVVGTLAMLLSAKVPLRAEHIVGVILAALGISRLLLTLGPQPYRWSPLFSLLLIVVGCVVLWQPQSILPVFVTALAILMTLEGLLEMFLAFQRHPTHYWGWILFAGFISLTLANIVWISIPFFDAISFSRIIAINLILYGLLLLMLVWQTKF